MDNSRVEQKYVWFRGVKLWNGHRLYVGVVFLVLKIYLRTIVRANK